MAKILVTGSTGTLGRPLVRELRARGHEVWGCGQQHDPDPQYRRADVGEYRQLEAVMRLADFEYVYHLAAEFGRLNGEEYYETLWRTNVVGTRHVLELQRLLGFKLLFASSSEIYGEVDAEWLEEDLPDHKSIMHPNDYAQTKWVNEQQIRNAEARWGAQCMRLRFFNAYGPGEYYTAYRSVVCLFVYRALHGLPFDVYQGYHRVFMYVEDFIPTLARVCERFTPGLVCNIGGREYRSVEELSDIVLQATGASRTLVRLWPEEKHNRRNKRPVNARAYELLGHRPSVELEQGVPLTVEWMRQVYGVRTP